jgi:hypothetical protein
MFRKNKLHGKMVSRIRKTKAHTLNDDSPGAIISVSLSAKNGSRFRMSATAKSLSIFASGLSLEELRVGSKLGVDLEYLPSVFIAGDTDSQVRSSDGACVDHWKSCKAGSLLS